MSNVMLLTFSVNEFIFIKNLQNKSTYGSIAKYVYKTSHILYCGGLFFVSFTQLLIGNIFMILNADVIIFVVFIICNLVFGLMSSKGVTSIRGYAIGNKDFNTATIVATIVATWVSGEFFFTIISEAYTKGFSFIWTSVLGDFLCLLFVGYVCAPRMAEFLGKLSIAEAMGVLYGNTVRLISSVSGFIGVVGIIGIQLKIAGIIFEHALGLSGHYGVVLAGVVVTLYSALGGIRSVTFTDVIQFATFGVVIPTLAYFLLSSLDNDDAIMDTITTHPLFDYKAIFDLSNPDFYYYISIFLFFIIPSFNPAIFQRVAMARDTKQVKKAFVTASVVCLLLAAAVNWIGVLILTIHPHIEENEIFEYIIADATWVTGFKGVILAGIMATIMSTVDSYINSSAVLVVHDFCEALKIKKWIRDELAATRFCSVLIGVAAIIFAMSSGSFLQLFIWANLFYMPIVTVPFIFAIFNFRTSTRSVLIGMGAGFFTAIIWEAFLKTGEIDGLIPAIFANVIFLLGSHYLFKKPEKLHHDGGDLMDKKKDLASQSN